MEILIVINTHFLAKDGLTGNHILEHLRTEDSMLYSLLYNDVVILLSTPVEICFHLHHARIQVNQLRIYIDSLSANQVNDHL